MRVDGGRVKGGGGGVRVEGGSVRERVAVGPGK